MNRKNMTRARAKQTSTPLSGNRGVALFNSFASVSTIRSEYRGTRHPVIESPILFDWESSLESPDVLEERRRSDTPLKLQRKSQFSYASAFGPVKLRFSRISDTNSKLSSIRRSSATVNKHLLCTDGKPVNKDKERIKNCEFRNTSVEKENTYGCALSHNERVCEKYNEESSKRSCRTLAQSKRKQMIQGDDSEKKIARISELHSKIITETACDDSFDSVQEKNKRRNIRISRSPPKKCSKLRGKDGLISRSLISKKDSMDEKCCEKSMYSSAHVTEIIQNSLRAGMGEENPENRKESRSKLKGKPGKRGEKTAEKIQSKSSTKESELNSNRIESGSRKGVDGKVKTRNRPLIANVTSKRTGTDRRRKTKMISLYAPTFTLYDSPVATNEKLPLVLECTSPVRSSERRGKSCCVDDIQLSKIIAKKTYAKNPQNYSKFHKDISKWESFRKKSSYPSKNNVENSFSKSSGRKSPPKIPPYQRKSDSCVRGTSFLKSRGSIHLFQRPAADVTGGIPVDDIFKSWDSLSRNKSSGKGEPELDVGDTNTTEEGTGKKWFETTKLVALADHFNDISEVSLMVEMQKGKREKQMQNK